MGTLKAEIYALLETDAQLHTGAELGSLLGLWTSQPYGVYFRNPPESVDFTTKSVITYFISTMVGEMPRDIFLQVTAWGNNFEAIQNRIYTLLHKARITTTDYAMLMMKWDWAGPESYADIERIYYQQHRFLIKAVKL